MLPVAISSGNLAANEHGDVPFQGCILAGFGIRRERGWILPRLPKRCGFVFAVPYESAGKQEAMEKEGLPVQHAGRKRHWKQHRTRSSKGTFQSTFK